MRGCKQENSKQLVEVNQSLILNILEEILFSIFIISNNTMWKIAEFRCNSEGWHLDL